MTPRRVLALSLLGTFAGCQSIDPVAFELGEELPGGETTNTFFLGPNALGAPAQNISAEHEAMFFSGNSFFNQAWVQAPASTTSRDGLGPLFNARSCAGCHFRDGRGAPLNDSGDVSLALLMRLTIQDEDGEVRAEPTYGGQFQPLALDGVASEGRVTVDYRERVVVLSGGEELTLLDPIYGFASLGYGPMHAGVRVSPRVAPAMIGLGLLEAIPEDAITSLADPDDEDGDGISGRASFVGGLDGAESRLGRFGWKAEQPSVRQQSAAAFNNDVGITNEVFGETTCTPTQVDCLNSQNGGEPEILPDLLDRVDAYSRLLAVPARQVFDDAHTLQGKALFHEAGCASCHTPSHQTGESDLPELSDQSIWPYTDLLLHDMGDALSDQSDLAHAEGREWRTPPLWGLRLFETVNGHDRLMHDGRARGVLEAIVLHGGEASNARNFFVSLDKRERDALVAFVESL